MPLRIPTYSICSLKGADHCLTEFAMYGLRDFLDSHRSIAFPHRHHFFQIVYFSGGRGQHSIDFQQYEVVSGQLYCMAPGQVHTWKFGPDTDGYILNFNESFITSVCHNSNFLYDFPMFTGLGNVLGLQAEEEARVAGHLQQMMIEYSDYSGEYKADLMRAMLVQLLVLIARNMQVAPVEAVSRHNLAVLNGFQRLIEQHYRKLRLPKEYADLLYITPNHLNSVCNAATGKSAGELIRDRILLEAKRMLVQKQSGIAEIGYALDFKDNAYFSRFFKKYTGLTPDEFRKINGNAFVMANA